MGPLSIGGRGTTISRAGAADGVVNSIDGIGGSAGGAAAAATGAPREGTGCPLTSVTVSGGGFHCAQPAATRTPRTVIIQSKSVIGTGEPFTASRRSTWRRVNGRVFMGESPSVAHVVDAPGAVEPGPVTRRPRRH